VESVQAMFTQYNQVIELMLLLAEERTQFERRLNARQVELDELRGGADGPERDPYVSCFVAMPFSDARAAEIYDAIRAVLEDKPYYWRVVRADDNTEMPGLWSNLKAKLLRAHCYVAVFTGDLNANVMIEIGRMEALERPLLILRDGAASELPADLHGLLFEELKATGSKLRGEVADALGRQQALQVLKGRDRFLSETVLTRDASLSEQASRQISRRYPAWQGFLDADSGIVASQIGIPRHLVDAVKETLRALHDAEA
jgi:hypothetical protein